MDGVTWQGGRDRRLVVGVLVTVTFLLPVLGAGQIMWTGPVFHSLVLGVVAPGVVAEETADRADALPGRPFDARPLPTTEGLLDRARAEVRSGRLDAALVVDFRTGSDVLVLPETQGEDVEGALRDRLEPVSASLGRPLATDVLPAERSPGASPATPYLLAVGWVLVGLAAAAALSAWRGPVAPSTARGAARLAGLTGVAVLVGVATVALLPASVDAPVVRLAAAATATVAVSAWLVLALEAVLGLAGLAVGVALLAGPLAPLLVQLDPAMMPMPWPWLYAVGVPGAALDLASGLVFGGTGLWRPRLLLGAWGLVAVLTLVSARAHRPVLLSRRGAARPSRPRRQASRRPRSR